MTAHKENPKVSVLIPTYNMGEFLDDSIQSVANQTFQDFELIIVDNCSEDNTEQVVQKYLRDERIHFFKNSRNIGMYGNWNKCLEYAKSKYIKFLNADDKLSPLILEKFVEILENDSEVSLVTSWREHFGGSYKIDQPPHEGKIDGKIALADSFFLLNNWSYNNWIGEPTSVMFRKKDLWVGGFKAELQWLADWDMWLRLLTAGDLYVVPEVLSYQRHHSKQATKDVKKDYINYFEEYAYYKYVSYARAFYHLDGYENFFKKQIKKAALNIFSNTHNFLLNKRFNLAMQSLNIAYAEGVLIKGCMLYVYRMIKKCLGLVKFEK